MTRRPHPGLRPDITRRTRTLADVLLYRVIALLGVIGVAVLLWAAALPRVAAAVSTSKAPGQVSATVVWCPPDSELAGQCRVRYVRHGHEMTAQLARAGVAGLDVGDHVPVWFDASGAPSISGWRSWADALALVGLAVAGSVGTLVLLRRVVSLELPGWDLRSSAGALLPRLR